MMNLFEGVRKMTDDEIRMQIALFRNVTLLNVAKETSGKVLGGLADIANAFAESFSKRTPFDFQVTRVCDMVRKEYDRLKANDRVQLEYELKKILTEKCRELVPEESEEPDEERLSFLIINEAAKSTESINIRHRRVKSKLSVQLIIMHCCPCYIQDCKSRAKKK